jgi:hypothetical protein
VRYKDTPRRFHFDLARSGEDELIRLLASPSDYDRDIARRLLTERLAANQAAARTRDVLKGLVTGHPSHRARLQALWVLMGAGPMEPEFLRPLMTGRTDPGIQAWAIRAVGDLRRPDRGLLEALALETASLSPDAMLQVAIAAPKLDWVETPVFQANALRLLMAVLMNAGDDPLIPHVVWQNLHPMLDREGQLADFVRIVRGADRARSPGVALILPRVLEKVLTSRRVDSAALSELVGLLAEGPGVGADAARQALLALAERLLDDPPSGGKVLAESFRPALERIIRGGGRNRELARLLATAWGDADALAQARALVGQHGRNTDARRLAFNALVAVRDPQVLRLVARILTQRPPAEPADYQSYVLARLSRLDRDEVAAVILAVYSSSVPP